jgi:hypothetical protein
VALLLMLGIFCCRNFAWRSIAQSDGLGRPAGRATFLLIHSTDQILFLPFLSNWMGAIVIDSTTEYFVTAERWLGAPRTSV